VRVVATQDTRQILCVVSAGDRCLDAPGQRRERDAIAHRPTLIGVDVENHAPVREPLAAVARHRVAVVQVAVVLQPEAHGPARGSLDPHSAPTHRLDDTEFPIGDADVTKRLLELHAFTDREVTRVLSIDVHAVQSIRVIRQVSPIFVSDGNPVRLIVH
jgi:hypothetical protein